VIARREGCLVSEYLILVACVAIVVAVCTLLIAACFLNKALSKQGAISAEDAELLLKKSFLFSLLLVHTGMIIRLWYLAMEGGWVPYG
jgi:hypothetical protein